MLNPGDYTIPFDFTLPTNIPGSIVWDKLNIYNDPAAVVMYGIKAEIVTHNNEKMKYTQFLVVNSPQVQMK
jgi:hypothetical protein